MNPARCPGPACDRSIRPSKWHIVVTLVILLGVWGYLVQYSHPQTHFWDSADYQECAQSLISGRGLMHRAIWGTGEPTWRPMTLWPPGYSTLIAGVMVVGVDGPTAGIIVSLIASGMLVAAVVWISMRVLSTWVAAPVALASISMTPLLQFSSYYLSDVAYAALAAASLACLIEWTGSETRSWQWLVTAGFLAGASFAVRYVGISLLVCSMVFVMVGGSRVSVLAASRAVVVWLLGAAICMVPLCIRNLALTGGVLPYSMPASDVSVWENVRAAALTIITDLSATNYLAQSLVDKSVLGAGLALILLAIIATCLSVPRQQLCDFAWKNRAVLLLVSYAGLYVAVVIAARSRYLWGEPIYSRYMFPVYWIIWIALASVAVQCFEMLGIGSKRSVGVVGFVMVAIALWHGKSHLTRCTRIPILTTAANTLAVPIDVHQATAGITENQIVLACRADYWRFWHGLNARKISGREHDNILGWGGPSLADMNRAGETGYLWGVIIDDRQGALNGSYSSWVQDLVRNPERIPELEKVVDSDQIVVFRYVHRKKKTATRPQEINVMLRSSTYRPSVGRSIVELERRLTPSMVAAYGFEEGAGLTVTDATGLGHTGTISGATWTPNGRFGNALAFNGSSSLVTIADADDLDFTTGMTVEAWVNPSSLDPNSWPIVIMKERPSGEVFSLYANADAVGPRIYAVVEGAPDLPLDAAGSPQIPLNTWSHLAATYDGLMLRIFVNGMEVRSRSLSGNLIVSNGDVSIGGSFMWNAYLSGRIDEIRLYNHALDPARIQADMNNPVSAGDIAWPEISNLNAVSISTSSATMAWLTDEPASSQVEYGLTPAYGNLTSVSPALVTSHSRQLTGLNPNTTYHYRVRSIDSAGNSAVSEDRTFATAPSNPGTPIVVYVAPGGADSNSGTLQSPFATLQRARDYVRALNENMSGDITVFLRQGEYVLPDTLELTQRDSGTNGHKVVWQAFPGEVPTISGGQKIVGWVHEGNGVYSAPTGGLEFLQFFVNGARATLARRPETGAYQTIGWNQATQTITLNSADAAVLSTLSPAQLRQVRLTFLQGAVGHITLRLNTITGNTVTIQEPEHTLIFQQSFPIINGRPYFLENALSFLDAEGEFYVDPIVDRVYYKARSGDNLLTTGVAVAPRLESLLTIRGTLDAPAERLSFNGLVFQDSTWLLPLREGYLSDQGSFRFVVPHGPDAISSYPSQGIPAAIDVRHGHHLQFLNNVVQRTGGSAVNFWVDVDDTTVVGNVFRDLSGSGLTIDLNLQGNPTDQRIVSRNLTVQNNFISGIGHDYYAGTGILATYVDSATIEHNEVMNSRYGGISVGWGWANLPNSSQNNVIRYNEVHNTLNLMADGGGIYTLSRQPNTLIAENYIHDITRAQWHDSFFPMAGIYLDEGSNFMTVRDNVGVNVDDVMVHLHMTGPDNVLQNNNGSSPAVIANAGLQPEFQDIRTPRARIDPITPNPRNSPVSVVSLEVSEPVTGVSLSDFVLNRNGVPVSMVGAVLSGTGSRYILNLAAVTVQVGSYELRLVASGSEIKNVSGYGLIADASATWTMDLTLPSVTSVVVGTGTMQRSMITKLRVVFSEIIQYVGADTAAFTLSKLSGGTVALSVSTVIVGGHTEATLTFLSDATFESLNDGRYVLTVHASQIRDLATNAMKANATASFHRLYGDVNGDAQVDGPDFSAFSSTYGLTASSLQFLSVLDFNNDGQIDGVDFSQFSGRYNTILP